LLSRKILFKTIQFKYTGQLFLRSQIEDFAPTGQIDRYNNSEPTIYCPLGHTELFNNSCKGQKLMFSLFRCEKSDV